MPQPLLAPPAKSVDMGLDAKAALIEGCYAAEDWVSVKRHLQHDPNSALLLTEARAHLRRIFGTNARVALDVVQEPEGEEPAMLFARIHADGDWQTCFAKMDRFDEEWWLDASFHYAAHLEFSIVL